MGLLVHLKQLFFYILSYVTCWSKKNSTSKVLPVATEERESKNDDSDQDDQENSDEEEEEETIQKEQEEAMENAMDAQGGIVQCIAEAFLGDADEEAEEEEQEEEEEENERTRVVDMWMNVLHAALTLYSVWSYLLTYVPDNASMMCRASHMIIVPLFKPAAASMWPALMPLVQFAHWNSKRLTKRPEICEHVVLPGERPFEYNWLSLLYVVLVAVAFSIYVFATIPIWPLLILFWFMILTAVFGIVFFFMHVPVEILRGRAFFCCRCRLWCFDKDDLVYMDNDELENLKYLLPKDVDQNLVPDGEDEKRRFYEQYTWDATDGDTGNDELTENINMLTLKSLTVVPIASCIGSLFFAPFYRGESSFSELVDSYMPTFNWSIFIFDLPTFSFYFDFEWNFVFQWPTDLELNFQIPMLVSFGLLLRLLVQTGMVHLQDNKEEVPRSTRNRFIVQHGQSCFL